MLAALLLFGFMPGVRAQEIVKEKVSVVNVEVPVRVFLDGVPLAGLGREDFRLSEGKVPQRINGFTVRRKRMSVQNIELRPEAAAAPSRYFVLVFRLLEYNDAMRKGVRHVFERLLREQDRVLVMVNERTLLLTPALDLKGRLALLDSLLEEEALSARRRLEQFFLSVQKDLDQTRLRTLLERDSSFMAQRIVDFLDRYLRVWVEFKNKYLIPDLDKFYRFARHLEKVSEEKWVLTFFQIEMFPNMKISGQIHREIVQLISELQVARPEDAVHARIIEQLLERIDRELNAADDFPVEEVSKMLVKVDTTYHCFIMGVQRETLSEDLEYKKVASDIENSLREITRRSGGEVIFSGDVGSSLRAIEKREDVYYVLTYEPRDPGRRGKVKVQLAGHPEAKLFYDDNIRADYISEYLRKKDAESPSVKIRDLAFKERKLSFVIDNFSLARLKSETAGMISVRIRVKAGDEKSVVDQTRPLKTDKDKISLSLSFPSLPAGKYDIIVDVLDQVSGKTCTEVIQPVVR